MDSPRQKSERTLGILCILCAAFCFSLMSLFVRLAGNIPTMQKIFFRNLVAAIAAFVILAREGQGFRIHKGCLGGHLTRSITGMLGMVANFWAIDHIGMADANMLNKLSPFFAILFSIFILREYPKKVDILSVLAAFIGAVFVVRPTAGIASLPSLAGVLGGLGAGAAYTFRPADEPQGRARAGDRDVFLRVHLRLRHPVLRFQLPADEHEAVDLSAAGRLRRGRRTAFHYRRVPPRPGEGDLRVLDYSQIVYAALWGFLVFGEIPDGAELCRLCDHHRRGGVPLHFQSARGQKGRRRRGLTFQESVSRGYALLFFGMFLSSFDNFILTFRFLYDILRSWRR